MSDNPGLVPNDELQSELESAESSRDAAADAGGPPARLIRSYDRQPAAEDVPPPYTESATATGSEQVKQQQNLNWQQLPPGHGDYPRQLNPPYNQAPGAGQQFQQPPTHPAPRVITMPANYYVQPAPNRWSPYQIRLVICGMVFVIKLVILVPILIVLYS